MPRPPRPCAAPALALSAALAVTAGAAAAPMEHHDLASLCLLAEHVVRAEDVASRARGADWNTTTSYRVTHVYAGGLAVGDTIEVYDDAYDLTLTGDHVLQPDGSVLHRNPLERDPERVLFLVEASPRPRTSDDLDDAGGRYQMVPSGVRVLARDRVFRVEQWSNPGAYRPVPQGPDPDDVFGRVSPADHAPLMRAEFERALEAAQARAAAAREALAIDDPVARDEALLALLPPPRTFPAPARIPGGGFAADALSRRLQQAIAEGGDLDSFLDAFGRDVVEEAWRLDARPFLDPDPVTRGDALLGAALDPARPYHHRDAALRVLGDERRALRGTGAAAIERIASLLADPHPGVRVAAIGALERLAHGDHGRWIRDTLVDAAAGERNAEVLIALGRAAGRLDVKRGQLDPRLSAELPLVAAVRPGPAASHPGATEPGASLTLGHAYLLPHHEWSPGVTLVARAADAEGAVRESAATTVLSATHGGDGGHGVARYGFEPALAPGVWTVALRIQVDPVEIDRPTLETVTPSIRIEVR